ncbi:MAG TPA: YciI family protein [Sphingobacteriaceae bacterium]
MEKFLLLIREDLARLEQMTEAEMQADIEEMTRWVEELSQAGNYLQGEPLMSYGRYVTAETILTDGPFIETKEAISGYLMITAGGLDQATSIAQSCPHIIKGTVSIEVRPVMQI